MKKCKSCGLEKDYCEFNKTSNAKDGYEGKCKVCRRNERKKHIIICKYCKSEFKSVSKDRVFCSSTCSGKSRESKVVTSCGYCEKEIEVSPYSFKKNKNNYCDNECRANHLRFTMKGEGNRNYKKVEVECCGCKSRVMVKPYKLKTQKYIFCSNECYKENIGLFFSGKSNPNYKEAVHKCFECNGSFKRVPSKNRGNRVFCTRECYLKHRKKQPPKHIVKLNCDNCGVEFERAKSSAKGKLNVYCSNDCAWEGFSKSHSGENNALWDHGKTEEERLISRKYPEYKEWRVEVYERDNYTCQKCHDNSGGNLVAHHILNYSEHKDLRTEITNGITLCGKCHKEFHDNYGYRKNNETQLEHFLNNH